MFRAFCWTLIKNKTWGKHTCWKLLLNRKNRHRTGTDSTEISILKMLQQLTFAVLRSLRTSNQLLMTISVTMFGVICIHLDTGAGDSTMPNYTILNIHRTGQAPGDGGSFVIFIHQARSGLPWHQYNVWPHPDVSHETNTSQSHLFYQKGDRIT